MDVQPRERHQCTGPGVSVRGGREGDEAWSLRLALRGTAVRTWTEAQRGLEAAAHRRRQLRCFCGWKTLGILRSLWLSLLS